MPIIEVIESKIIGQTNVSLALMNELFRVNETLVPAPASFIIFSSSLLFVNLHPLLNVPIDNAAAPSIAVFHVAFKPK